MTHTINRSLHDFLCEKLSYDEVRAVCFALDIDYDSIFTPSSKSAFIQSLITYLKQRDRIIELLETVQARRVDLAQEIDQAFLQKARPLASQEKNLFGLNLKVKNFKIAISVDKDETGSNSNDT